jgi:holo-[acyl-carrier protein] synthase
MTDPTPREAPPGRVPAPPPPGASLLLGIGSDLVEVERIEGLMAKRGARFKAKLFTDEETRYCEAQARPAVHFAARFAAKEAFSKALGTGIAQGVQWRDVGVVHRRGGQPALVITGATLDILRERGGGILHLTLAHTTGHAMATVVIERAAAAAPGTTPAAPPPPGDPSR